MYDTNVWKLYMWSMRLCFSLRISITCSIFKNSAVFSIIFASSFLIHKRKWWIMKRSNEWRSFYITINHLCNTRATVPNHLAIIQDTAPYLNPVMKCAIFKLSSYWGFHEKGTLSYLGAQIVVIEWVYSESTFFMTLAVAESLNIQ